MEKEWEKFRDIVMECANDVCSMRHVGGQRRKGSEWWNGEVGWPKREELLRNGFREKIGLPMTDTGRIKQTVHTRRWGRGEARDIAICGSLTIHFNFKNRC